ncbi:MAG TPA: TonB-dependent receptor [Gemmatimonadaceae bacterium]|nr:TonB-dependent receptor [Gemmatimonadaceae bacterium]
MPPTEEIRRNPRGGARRLQAMLVVGAVAALGEPLAAQVERDSAATDSAARSIEAVVTTAPAAPATVGGASALVLRVDSLRTSPAPVLEDLLREVPFVAVRQNSRGEAELTVRGSDSRQVAVLLDGLPLTLGWDHRTDPSLVPIEGAQRVVVVRGLSSLLHGPNVLGGVVEVEVSGGAESASRPELTLGSGVDQYGALAMTVGGGARTRVGTGALVARGGVAYRARDGVALGRDVADPQSQNDLRTNSDLRHRSAFGSLRYSGSAGFVGLTTSGYDAARGVPPELHVAEPRLWRYPDQSRALAVLSAGTRPFATPLGLGRLDGSAGYNAGWLAIESFDDREYRVLSGRELGRERTASGRLQATHSLGSAGEVRTAITFADIRYDETIDADPTSRYRQRLWSGAAELQRPLFSRALVTGGVAYDGTDTPRSGGKPSLGERSAWGWRLGTTAALGERVQLHASASRRARFPALRELYSGALNRFEPNPTLRPERLLGAEAGVTAHAAPAGGSTQLQAVVFHHRLEDAVVRTTVPATRRFLRVNRDEIRSTGLELFGSWSTRAAISLEAEAVAQRIRVYDPSTPAGERRPEHQPELRGDLELGVPLPLRVRGVAGGRYTGRQFCVHPDLGRQVALADQGEASVALERTWTLASPGSGALLRAARALVALDNVTDATVYDQCGLPQPGRTLRFGLQIF